jgi:hypothetical protein
VVMWGRTVWIVQYPAVKMDGWLCVEVRKVRNRFLYCEIGFMRVCYERD